MATKLSLVCASTERVHAVADRDEALDAAVDAWAADVAAGRETGLYAWRRRTWPSSTPGPAWMDRERPAHRT